MSLKKNVFSNFILTSTNILFPLIVFPYITRILTNVNIGKIFFIDAFTQYFIIFASIGIPFYGVREIAKLKHFPEQRSKLVAELVIIQLILSLFYSLVFYLLHFFVSSIQDAGALIEIGCITIISNSFLIEWYYQGIENFSYITKRSLIIKGLGILAILLLVKKNSDGSIYYLIMALITLTNALLNYLNFINRHSKPFKFGELSFKKHFRPLFILFSINISLSVYTLLDTVILGILTNPESVSLYNVPLKIVKVFWLVVGGIGTVLIPRMSNLLADKDMDNTRLLMTKSFNIVFLLTLPFCFFCLCFPKEILYIVSGGKYIAAFNALRILAPVPLIIGVCNVLGSQFLLPFGLENKVLHATIIGLILSLSANFLLIPQLNFLGSSIGCVIAETAVCVYVFFAARKEIKLKLDLNLFIQITLAIAMSFILSIVFKHFFFNELVSLLLTFFSYIVIFLVLQFIFFKNKFVFSLLHFKKNSRAK